MHNFRNGFHNYGTYSGPEGVARRIFIRRAKMNQISIDDLRDFFRDCEPIEGISIRPPTIAIVQFKSSSSHYRAVQKNGLNFLGHRITIEKYRENFSSYKQKEKSFEYERPPSPTYGSEYGRRSNRSRTSYDKSSREGHRRSPYPSEFDEEIQRSCEFKVLAFPIRCDDKTTTLHRYAEHICKEVESMTDIRTTGVEFLDDHASLEKVLSRLRDKDRVNYAAVVRYGDHEPQRVKLYILKTRNWTNHRSIEDMCQELRKDLSSQIDWFDTLGKKSISKNESNKHLDAKSMKSSKSGINPSLFSSSTTQSSTSKSIPPNSFYANQHQPLSIQQSCRPSSIFVPSKLESPLRSDQASKLRLAPAKFTTSFPNRIAQNPIFSLPFPSTTQSGPASDMTLSQNLGKLPPSSTPLIGLKPKFESIEPPQDPSPAIEQQQADPKVVSFVEPMVCEFCDLTFDDVANFKNHLASYKHEKNFFKFQLSKEKGMNSLNMAKLKPKSFEKLCSLLNMNSESDVTALAESNFFAVKTKRQALILRQIINILAREVSKFYIRQLPLEIQNSLTLYYCDFELDSCNLTKKQDTNQSDVIMIDAGNDK